MVAAATLLVLFAGNRLWSKRQQSAQVAQQFRGTLYPQGAAHFTHQRTASEEWVRLSEGTLRVEVRPLAAGERFRLFTGDGEVEVRGTAFEAQVQKDKLRHVLVLHGLVEVRPYSRTAVLLGPLGSWQAEAEVPAGQPPAGQLHVQQPAPPASAPASTAAASVAKAPNKEGAMGSKAQAVGAVAKPPSAVVTKAAAQAQTSVALAPTTSSSSATPEPTAKPASETTTARVLAAATRTPAEAAFADGWTSLRHSQYEAAAAAFARVIALGGGEPILEDARFWRGVALARAGHSARAIEALREFMTHHQASPRLGEAASILGWQLLKAGQLDEAERRFQTALRDARPEVSDSARAGLQSVTAAKNQPAPQQ
jgi:TolA-binding protein